jgi:dipicolinate synthase subunit A
VHSDPIPWDRLHLAIVGGDERETEIARLAGQTGATVRAFGFPWPEGGIHGVVRVGKATEALRGADYALLPIPRGVEGSLYVLGAMEPIPIEPALFSALRPGAHVFCGRVTEALATASRGHPVTLHDYDSDPELMLERAAAIVEGALEAAIANTNVTIHGTSVAVVGFGKIGSLLARRLHALGAHVHVAARNPVQRASARAQGMRSLTLDELATRAPQLAMVFSAVPARVVDRRVLERLPRGSLVLDIVPPGDRSDLELAARLGHRAVWARGLGRRAPVTVGRSQWLGVRRRINEIEAASNG